MASCSRVDPRVRGGGQGAASIGSPCLGRSPRTRGRHKLLLVGVQHSRSIPAYAGEAGFPPDRCLRCTVDPRVRGGGPLRSVGRSPGKGRSPRTRGRLPRQNIRSRTLRSIPAYAGEAGRQPLRRRSRWVDPRVRGGGDKKTMFIWFFSGRSPRTRGRQRCPSLTICAGRSIPAYAGEALIRLTIGLPTRVDPRVRGGGAVHRHGSSDQPGRSPRTRGRPVTEVTPVFETGSIPAYAGEAYSPHRRHRRRRVDPRVRGGGQS